MSARSRALGALADHMIHLRDQAEDWGGNVARPIYTAWDVWDRGADMARRTALEETWTQRFLRLFPLDFRVWLEQIRTKHDPDIKGEQ